MAQAGVQLASIVQDRVISHHPPQPQPQPQPLPQRQESNNHISVASQAKTGRLKPNLPRRYLFVAESRENYIKTGLPLYEAAIKCNWEAAKSLIEAKPELVRYSITENGETALHVAASAKGDPKDVEEFVKNLVGKMKQEDLALENENFNTALYLAAAAGNVEAVKIMVGKNKMLVTIPGAGKMLPLYTAALFGNYDVVTYLYGESKDLSDDCWNPQNRGWLLEKCVENNMFDVALNIIKKYPELGRSGSALKVLARKPEAFRETKSNIVWKKINSALSFIGVKVRATQKESTALTLLRFIWEDIAKRSKKEIDFILRGPPDSIEQDHKTVSGLAIQAMQLEKLIYEHIAKMKDETNNIIRRPPNFTNQNPLREEQALQLQNLIFERLVNMHAETQKIVKGPRDSVKQENKPNSSKGDLVLKLQNLIFEHIANMREKTQNIKTLRMEDQAPQLEQVISSQIKKMDAETQKILKEPPPAKETHSSRVLFIAAELGNTEFLVELIRQYPDLIWKVNDDKQSIFHIAVKHRHEGIYNLLYEIGAMKDLITPLKDPKENNMLHLVGKIAKQKRLEDVSGVALQMQRELLWFEEVKNMIPPSYRERVNKDGLTPHELFTNEHKELVSKGEEWMKGTASQCMVVAALIATIVFAAAFTVPGGYAQTDDKYNGIPVFRSKATFMVFVVADAISLFASSASILIFLSILTSRYAEVDFLDSLPKKLVSGLLTLFLSIITMTVAFGVSFFVLYHQGLIWMPILICVFAGLPVVLYIWLQYGLFYDVIRSTYISKYIFKPGKSVLYYKNPSV